MRNDRRNHNATEITRAAGYHGSKFKKLNFYASDRPHPLETWPLEKTKGVGFEIETVTALLDSRIPRPRRDESEPITCYHERNKDVEQAYFNLLDKLVFAPLGEDFVRIEEDSSLGNTDAFPCGGEVVTQIASKAAWRNKYAALREVYDKLMPVYKITCTKSNECGMHANVSAQCFGATKEKQTDAIRKLYWLINKDRASWELIARCFNRPASLFNNPNCHGGCGYWAKMPCPSKDWIKTWDCWDVWEHAVALNCTHLNEGRKDSRVEVRLMGGQDNYFCFRNSVEVLFHLVDRVTTISWDRIDDWTEVFKDCNQYVLKRLDRCRQEGYLSNTDYEKIKATVKPINLELD